MNRARFCWIVVGAFVGLAVSNAAAGHAWSVLLDCVVVGIWAWCGLLAEDRP